MIQGLHIYMYIYAALSLWATNNMTEKGGKCQAVLMLKIHWMNDSILICSLYIVWWLSKESCVHYISISLILLGNSVARTFHIKKTLLHLHSHTRTRT